MWLIACIVCKVRMKKNWKKTQMLPLHSFVWSLSFHVFCWFLLLFWCTSHSLGEWHSTQSQKSMELIWSLARGEDDVNAHRTNIQMHERRWTKTNPQTTNEVHNVLKTRILFAEIAETRTMKIVPLMYENIIYIFSMFINFVRFSLFWCEKNGRRVWKQ